MFEDIIGKSPEDEKQEDEKQEEKQNRNPVLKEGNSTKTPEPDCSGRYDCGCPDCLEKAIKDLADQMGLDLDNEELEDIKIEYYDTKGE